ncbi:hypothetical protein B0T16DRAFT_505527 [Cercophora newfieldiana]|uniref:Uncharacterized protein n=1 Tax=Cercophora newfieldiana TaxID=92897 RepID=A0AA40CXI9_9PEZI|nr:hypothetical protein B0T16DRAFT_505527 [Cercophora newfieldiana]
MRTPRRSGRPKPFGTIDNLRSRWGDPPTTFDAPALVYLCRGLIREFNLRPRAARRNLRIRAEWMRICSILYAVGKVLPVENDTGRFRLGLGNLDGVENTRGTSFPANSKNLAREDEHETRSDSSELASIDTPSSSSTTLMDGDGRAPAASKWEQEDTFEWLPSLLETAVNDALSDALRKMEVEVKRLNRELGDLDLHGSDADGREVPGGDDEKQDEKDLVRQRQQTPDSSPANVVNEKVQGDVTTQAPPRCSEKYPTKLRLRVPPKSKIPMRHKAVGLDS